MVCQTARGDPRATQGTAQRRIWRSSSTTASYSSRSSRHRSSSQGSVEDSRLERHCLESKGVRFRKAPCSSGLRQADVGATPLVLWPTGVGGPLSENAAGNAFFDIPKTGLVRTVNSEHVRAHFDANADLPTILSAVCAAVIAGHTHTLSMEKKLDLLSMRFPNQDDIIDFFWDSEEAEDLLPAEEKAEAMKVTKNCAKLTSEFVQVRVVHERHCEANSRRRRAPR